MKGENKGLRGEIKGTNANDEIAKVNGGKQKVQIVPRRKIKMHDGEIEM